MMNYTQKRQLRAGQGGAGLLEVLVAVLVLGIGVLGIAALQSVALKNSGSSASTTNATIQAYAALDMLRAANLDAKTCEDFKTNGSNKYQGSSSGNLGTKEGWLSSLKTTVAPDAKGKIDCDCNKTPIECTVGVQWDDTRGSGGKAAQQVEASSQL